MIIDEQHKAAFAEYEESLGLLELAFNAAGLDVEFECCVDTSMGRIVCIIKKNKLGGYRNRYICIEGDSPAQAIKDVATGVKL